MLRVGLGLICAATLLLEIVTTRFFAIKLSYHYSFLMVSTTLLGMGVGAFAVGLFARRQSRSLGRLGIARLCAAFGATSALGVLVFVAAPLRAGIPFLGMPALFWFVAALLPAYAFAGAVITAIFAVPGPGASVGSLYALDLACSAAGAALSVVLLAPLGGYGVVALASLLGVLAGWAALPPRAALAGLGRAVLPLAALGALLVYPKLAWRGGNFDVQPQEMSVGYLISSHDFGGIEQVYWSPLGRLHVSGIGTSQEFLYRYGIAARHGATAIPGRFLFADLAIALRQFLPTGPVREQAFLGDIVWAAPYQVRRGAERTLIIGGGGGVDIAVARHFGIREILAAEINPQTYALLKGRREDPHAAQFREWYAENDGVSHLDLRLSEGRLLAAGQPDGTFDFIVSNATDTHTAANGRSYNLTENFLYTLDAMRDYLRIAKPDGIVGISYWSSAAPIHALRVFATMSMALRERGLPPATRMVALAGGGYFSMFAKKTELTAEELRGLETWAQANEFAVLYLPGRGEMPKEPLPNAYWHLARDDGDGFGRGLEAYPYDIRPVRDEMPYFYLIDRFDRGGIGPLLTGLAPFGEFYWIFVPLAVAAIALVFVSGRSWVAEGAAFALSGMGFSFLQMGALMLLSLLVGGPYYSIAAVLPAMLAGYALASFASARLGGKREQAGAVGLMMLFPAALGAGLLPLAHALLPAGGVVRFAVALAISAGCGLAVGWFVPGLLDRVKARDPGRVPWMWAINSLWNVIGALMHVALIRLISVSGLFLSVSLCYGFAYLLSRRSRA